LLWLTYIHVAIQVGIPLFLLWANTQIVVTLNKRIVFNVLAIVLGYTAVIALDLALSWTFSREPSSMFSLVQYPRWVVVVIALSPLLSLPLTSLGAIFILQLVGYRTKMKYLLWSTGLIWVSIPICQGLLRVTNDVGGSDLIHTVKSGFIFPLLAFSVGFVIAKSRPKNAPSFFESLRTSKFK
jgi:hypothetical protein